MLPSVQWPQTLERNEDDTGDQDGPDVKKFQDQSGKLYDSPPLSMALIATELKSPSLGRLRSGGEAGVSP